MATYKAISADATPLPVPREAGAVSIVNSKFDFSIAAQRPATLVSTDKVQIGVVPAGCVMVQHLSRIVTPAFDTNGAPTGDFSIGTADAPTALKAAGAAETPLVLTGEDLLASTVIGARDVDTPIYAVFTANVATVTTTGVIVANLAIRPFDGGFDG